MLPVIGSLISTAASSLDKLFTSDDERAKAKIELDKLRNDLGKAVLEHEKTLIAAQRTIIEKELQSGSWIARNWRPVLMLVFTTMIAYNFLLIPIADFIIEVFNLRTVVLINQPELPENVWDLLKIGLGGYIVGRSGEKIAKNLRS